MEMIVQYEYLWADGIKVKRPTKCSAPDYVNQLFDWIESQVLGRAFQAEIARHQLLQADVSLGMYGMFPSMNLAFSCRAGARCS